MTQKKNARDRRKLFTRIISLTLAGLMVFSVVLARFRRRLVPLRRDLGAASAAGSASSWGASWAASWAGWGSSALALERLRRFLDLEGFCSAGAAGGSGSAGGAGGANRAARWS